MEFSFSEVKAPTGALRSGTVASVSQYDGCKTPRLCGSLPVIHLVKQSAENLAQRPAFAAQ